VKTNDNQRQKERNGKKNHPKTDDLKATAEERLAFFERIAKK
jgi:hypothetical protein